MAFFQQTWTLTSKNLRIVLIRHGIATAVRAFILPIGLMVFLSFAKNLLVPSAVYGIGHATTIKTLQDALSISGTTGRDTVVFVNNGFTGGEIDRVIRQIVPAIEAAGKNATVLTSEDPLSIVCRSSLRSVSTCYGAVIFHASPKEGSGGFWNYTIKSDGALGLGRINVNKDNNDGETYMLPFQHAIDAAITSNYDGSSNRQPLSNNTQEYPYTALTTQERDDNIRVNYQGALINFLGVAFIAGVIGVSYHLTGFMASERESGMSTLLESMMPTNRRWHAQAARLLSYHICFSVVYLPGIIIGSLIIWRAVFAHTSGAIIVIYYILMALALVSTSIFGAALFRQARMSGSTVVLVLLILAIIAQTISYPKAGQVAVLSLLFAPCNFTYFISYLARWEQQQWPANLVASAPGSPWAIPGIVLWIFLILQIIIYPILGAFLEAALHGTTSNTRTIVKGDDLAALGPGVAVRLEGFTKIYKPGFFQRLFAFIAKKEPVVAVNDLNLEAGRGQILVLLGANGSGKSTTLDNIAGTNKLTSGKIIIDGTGGMGIAPQKNVLWDELTVEEHLVIFNKLKSPHEHAPKAEIKALIDSIDLHKKQTAMSKTLSGGQKRKLQLGMMLTGGSKVVCVDEVSSGIDPISRRKIWDILLKERGQRTIIMTTHFLDEADLLGDKLAILSKGTLRCVGSSVELKQQLGGGYRIYVPAKQAHEIPDVDRVAKKEGFEGTAYVASSSDLAANVIKELESHNIRDYRLGGPSIEDVFLQVAEEVRGEGVSHSSDHSPTPEAGSEKNNASGNVVQVLEESPKQDSLELLSGKRIGFVQQGIWLFRKRCTLFKTGWFPYAAAFIIPVIAGGLVMLFTLKPVGCSPGDGLSQETAVNIFASDFKLYLVAGPASKVSNQTLINILAPIYLASTKSSGGGASGNTTTNPLDIFRNLTIVNTFDDFNNFIVSARKNVTPAGIWLGDSTSQPTVAYKGTSEMFSGWFGQWVMDMLLTNTTIASEFVNFDIPWSPDAGQSLQLLVYVGLALCAAPAFFSLYPNVERRRFVRALEYSNGVRQLPLWLAYTAFDFAIMLVACAIVLILFTALSDIWYHVGYLYLIFILFCLDSILLSYNISMFATNQLSSYAFTAAYQAVMLLVYLIAYLCTITYAPVNKVDSYLVLVHFLVSAFAPIGSLVRSLFLALNLFSTACTGNNELSTTPGGILQYGGPILYLFLQAVILFGLLLWLDSGNVGSSVRALFQRKQDVTEQDATISDEEVANELTRVTSSVHESGETSADGLRVVHLTKRFGRNTAVDNVTFGIKRGEVYALLGPNGAGKSTTISLIRGDIKPSARGGDVFVEGISVSKHLAQARSHLGVCPQFDALDQMTVRDHLVFYARIRGIADVEHNVRAVLRAVGLEAFQTRQAHALSGGNKRKLSLAIALMGNPTVVLLDEPSSGLDAAAKRIMWRTLAATAAGRSILLTTHSMEEADALASRAGILARRMLAMGTTEQLRARFGDALHIHIICAGAPHTSDADIETVRRWVVESFPGAEVEAKSYHGQLRFSVPASAVARSWAGANGNGAAAAAAAAAAGVDAEKRREQQEDVIEIHEEKEMEEGGTRTVAEPSAAAVNHQSAIGQLVVMLEEHKAALGIEHYSVSPTTLDQVFLGVVGKHNVEEEGYEEREEANRKRWWQWSRR